MSNVTRELLSLALRVKWETAGTSEKQALQVLAQRMPGLDAASYAEAYARAKALDEAAWTLADRWHASRGSTSASVDDLSSNHPGFATADYAESLAKNLEWASK
jgi:hypothetical protein